MSLVCGQPVSVLPPLEDLGLPSALLEQFSDSGSGHDSDAGEIPEFEPAPSNQPALEPQPPAEVPPPPIEDPNFENRWWNSGPRDYSNQANSTERLVTPQQFKNSRFPNSAISTIPLRIKLDRFTFRGQTAFSEDELAAVVDDYRGRLVTTEDLESARLAVTRHYYDHGYITSGALIPDQTVGGTEIAMDILEGRLSHINLKGNWWLRDAFIRKRIELGAGQPLNLQDLERPLALLQRNPNIRKINAELKPDAEPGLSYLELDVKEEFPIRGGLEFHNRRPASVGEEQIEFWLTDTSLTRSGDILELRYGLLDQGFDQADVSDLSNYSISYSLPVTKYDTRLEARYSENSYTVIEEPFFDLDIEGQSSVFRAGVRHPLIQSQRKEFALGLYFDHMKSETTLFDLPFTLTAGAVNGETEFSALRFTQEWTSRSQKEVLGLRSTFSMGVDAFDATDDGTERNSEYFSWLGEAQYTRRLGDSNAQMVLRGSLQLSDDPLLSLEQFSIGGMHTVRGYRENQLVRDNGYLASLEFRIPLLRGNDRRPILSIAPFVDVGGGWNHELENSNLAGKQNETIASAGVGLLFNPTKHIEAELYWGHAFTDFDSPDETLQDEGVHFRVAVGRF